jgi:4-hydroxy-2-oxoheptanedioate aldolase
MKTLNPVQDKIRSGRAVHGAIVTMPSPAAIRILANSGFDLLLIDMEHGAIGPSEAHALILATAGTLAVPMVRIADNLPWLAKPMLDAGALGVCVPMVMNRAHADAASAAVRYPPRGHRMWGPFHAPARWGLAMGSYMRAADDAVTSMVTIEHPSAIAAIEEIASAPDIDVAIIGPGDLATSMGHLGDADHAETRKAIEHAESVLLRSRVATGGVARTPDEAAAMVRRGYRVIFHGVDAMLLARGAAAALGPFGALPA